LSAPETPSYDDMIRDLSRSHPVVVSRDDSDEYTSVDGLIQQLRDEVFGGTDKGATSGNKNRLPLNAPALDLYTLIDRQISEVWGATFARIPGADKPERLLAQWAAHANPLDVTIVSSPETIYRNGLETVVWLKDETTAINLLSRWHRSITELFDPPRVATNPAACVQCGARESWQRRDGQTVKSTALALIIDRSTDRAKEMRCRACGAIWDSSVFEWLNGAIEANEKRLEDLKKVGA